MPLFKYRYFIGIVFVFGVIGFAGAFSLASNRDSAKGEQSQLSDSFGDADPSVKADFFVDIKDGRAYPDTLTVPQGKTVQFNTRDSKKHNITLGEGAKDHQQTSSLSSGDFGKDEAWRATFEEVGTFSFYDRYNPSINVLIVAYRPSVK